MVHNLTICLHKAAGIFGEIIDISAVIFPYLAIALMFISITRVAYYTVRTLRSTTKLMSFLRRNALPTTVSSITGSPDGNDRVHVFTDARNQSAFTLGCLHPRVYLSSAMIGSHNQRELDIIIQHEFGHRMRRDPLCQFLWNLLSEFLWFIPIIKARVERIKISAEMACDAYAERQGHSPTAIANILVDIAGSANGGFFPKPACNSISDQLELRVHALLGNNPWSLMRRSFGALLISILMIMTLMSAGSMAWAKAADPDGIDTTLRNVAAGCTSGRISGEADMVFGIPCPHCSAYSHTD